MMNSILKFLATVVSVLVLITFAGCGTEPFPWADESIDVGSDAAVDDVVGNDLAGQDVIPSDAEDANQTADSLDGIEDAAADVPVELPSQIAVIDNALDPAFMQPNKGLTFKIIAPYLASIPDSELTADQKSWVLESELILRSGKTVAFSQKESAFIAEYPLPEEYNDSYVFINADSALIDDRYSYNLNVYPMLSTFSWMKANQVDSVSGDYFSFIIYRSGYFNPTTYVTCPVMTGTSNSSSEMYVHFDEDTLTPGQPLGIMLNSYVTDDRKAIAELSGVAAFHDACYCYDVAADSYSPRACTLDDMDQLPGMPQAVAPQDGAEGVSAQPTDTVLQWTSSGDADGGNVTYDVYFGTDNPPANKVLTGSTATSWAPPVAADTTYFWRVEVTDDEGNTVVGPNWTFNTDADVPVLENHNYLVIVDKRLQGLLDTEIEQYVWDVTAEGQFTPAVRYWMPGSHQKLKEIIKESYDNSENGLLGIFLIGDLPGAWYEQDSDFGGDIGIMHEEFPTELYFQDMDGVWTDSDGNGMFDGHPEITLELFSSRLVGDVEEIRAYLNRIHDYRVNGSFFETRRFFSFVDDDWNGANATGTQDPYYTGQTWGLSDIYGSEYIRREWSDNTSKQDYLDVMATGGGAEFVYQWIHSDPQRIYFDDNFSPNPDNILGIDELVSMKMQGSFYNLFDCSISRYTEPDGNMASQYLFGDKGLATIGSTKTGGIFNPEVLHMAILEGQGFGEALRLWFNDTWTNRADYGFDIVFFDGWWLGMMNQGDPLIKLDTTGTSLVNRSLEMPRSFSPEQLHRLNRIMYRRGMSTKVGSYSDYLRGQKP
jgi:hypothetical protein